MRLSWTQAGAKGFFPSFLGVLSFRVFFGCKLLYAPRFSPRRNV